MCSNEGLADDDGRTADGRAVVFVELGVDPVDQERDAAQDACIDEQGHERAKGPVDQELDEQDGFENFHDSSQCFTTRFSLVWGDLSIQNPPSL